MHCVPQSYESYRTSSIDSIKMCNSRRTSASASTIANDLLEIDEDYGHYCDEIELNEDDLEMSNDSDDSNWLQPNSNNSGMMCSGSVDIFEDDATQRGSGTVAFEMKEEDAPLNCRFFPAEGLSLGVSVVGARIIEGLPHSPKETEYCLKVMVNGIPKFSVWRRYYHFECLAEACLEYSYENPEIGMPVVTDLKKSLNAWRIVQEFRPNINISTSSYFLSTESTLIKKYIKYLLFEAPHSEMILGFVEV